MKICLITNIYQPYELGGTEVYVKTLANALRENDHDVFVITTCPPQKHFRTVINETIDEIRVYRFYPLNLYWGYRAQEKSLLLKSLWHLVEQWNPHVYFTVKRILDKELPEVVHINNVGGFSNSIFWACQGDGRKVVYTLHDYISICPKSIKLRRNFEVCQSNRLPCKIYQTMKRWSVSRRVDFFICPSFFSAQLHKQDDFPKNGTCSVIPHGIEVSSLDSRAPKTSYGNDEQDSSVNVLYLGQIVPHKGVSLLAKAFKKVSRNDLRLHIAGDGDYSDPLQDELKDLRNVTFHGHVTGEAKERLLAGSDVCVLPSICYETAGLVILEAYKYGLPVIGSRIGAIPEMIAENRTGFLFEPGDESDLVSVLQNISKERLGKMANDCRQAAMSYSMENHLDKLFEVYTRLTQVAVD
jgi:glycosyltransferase involved in cell wall biosynthesis